MLTKDHFMPTSFGGSFSSTTTGSECSVDVALEGLGARSTEATTTIAIAKPNSNTLRCATASMNVAVVEPCYSGTRSATPGAIQSRVELS